MTIKQAIDTADAVKPNRFTREVKTKWLINLENRIYNEIYLTHEHNEQMTVPSGEDEEAELFVPQPYDEMYILYLAAKIDSRNAEYGRYNNEIKQFNEIYSDFEKFWQSKHMPLSEQKIRY